MNDKDYLYLIKIIDDNKIQLVLHVDTIDGVLQYEGNVCAVLKRYEQPVDMLVALEDVQRYSSKQLPTQKYGSNIKARKEKSCSDHLGNYFDSIYQLCAYYGITETKYRSRLSNGWTQAEALTGIREKSKAIDHLGNVFNSKAEMCQHYNIPLTRYNARIKLGRTIEEALLGIAVQEDLLVEDHLGNKYKNVSQMCRNYGVRLDLYCRRKERGWTLEEILTGKKKADSPVFDHNGKEFSDLDELCKEYNVSKNNYNNRIKNAWTVEEALTGIRKDNLVYDHLGNIFLSQKDMCESYGLKVGTFRTRMKKGWTLERSLTVDTTRNPAKNVLLVLDHLGNEFKTIQEMCDAYGVKKSTLSSRLRKGYTLEKALTTVLSNGSTLPDNDHSEIIDHKGNKYKDLAEMCAHYGISTGIYLYRLRNNWSLADILEIPKKQKPHVGEPVCDHNGNEFASLYAMCDAYGIRIDTYKYRLKRGLSIEEALTKALSRVTTNQPCQDHLGNQYESMAEMYRTYGIRKDMFISRRKAGWPLEKILTTGVNESRGFIYDGKTYASKREFCRLHELNYESFVRKIKAGISIDEAMMRIDKQEKKNEPVFDYKGIQYRTVKEMCDAYNISYATYNYRKKNDWELEEILTRPKGFRETSTLASRTSSTHICYDHNGNAYSSKKAMCEAYGVSYYMFSKMLKEGHSTADALKGYKNRKPRYIRKDHLGHEYSSLKAMCDAYNISVHTYQKRVSKGYTIEKALTAQDVSDVVQDHLGNIFGTINEMCSTYNISPSLFYSRIKRGKSIGEALTFPKEDCSVEYKGKKYPSHKDLAADYSINYGTLSSRIQHGWTLDEAVSGIKKSRAYYDHLGIEYPSLKVMCNNYRVSPATYQGRIKNGWTVEQALLNNPPEKIEKPRNRHDHLGNEYPDLESLCKAHNITVHDYQKRMTKGYGLEKTLTCNEPKSIVLDHLGHEYESIKDMCSAYGMSLSLYYSRLKSGKSLEEVLTKQKAPTVIEYRGKQYSGLTALAKSKGISSSTLKRRLDLEWTLDEAITGIKKSRQVMDHRGKIYPSVKVMCEVYTINPAVYSSRIKNGWTVHKALTTPVKPRKKEDC